MLSRAYMVVRDIPAPSKWPYKDPHLLVNSYDVITCTFTTISSAKRKLIISRPPMLTLPSWSSNVSHIILSRKMVKRVGESRHPCRTPTVVLKHLLCCLWTGLHSGPCHTDCQWLVWCWHWCCISSYLPIRLRAIPCQRHSWRLWRHGSDSADAAGISRRGSCDWIFVLFAPSGSETCLLFYNDLFCLWLESFKDDHDLTKMAYKADGSVVLAQLQVAFLFECDN